MLVVTCCNLCLGGKKCEIWEARAYRDCTCGIQVLDFEEHCQDDHTYYQPTSSQNTHYCEFQCENGGELTRINPYYCECKPGTEGRCCQNGLYIIANYNISNKVYITWRCHQHWLQFSVKIIKNVYSYDIYFRVQCVASVESQYCGGLKLEPNGIIASPSFPYYHYPDDIECLWRITTDPGKRIAIGVKDNSFDVEEGTSINTCDTDWVAVYDGMNKNASRIGPFCGNTSRPFQTIHSSSRHLYIEFRSNNVTQRRGFQLEYTTYRQGSNYNFVCRIQFICTS